MMSVFYKENRSVTNFTVSVAEGMQAERDKKNSFSQAPADLDLYMGSGRVIGQMNPEIDSMQLDL